jgi:hypothetical protein
MALALSAGHYDAVIDAYESAPKNVKVDGRVTMTYAYALLYKGNVTAAEEILHRDGGLLVTDIREVETTLTSLYIKIEQAKAAERGISLDESDVDVPRRFDFRMYVPKKK